MKTVELIEMLENFAPPETAEPWDNSGWQIKFENNEVTKIMLCISITERVVQEAIANNVNLILSHHPLIFPCINRIDDKKIIDLIKNNIQVYSLHTNFDKAKEGTSGLLAQKLGFDTQNSEKLNDFVILCEFDDIQILDDLLLKYKLILNLDKIKTINYAPFKRIKKVAFCAGSGGEFVELLNKRPDVDLFITSDIKYHTALDVLNYTVFDIGHLQSELPSISSLKQLLSTTNLEIMIANEKDNAKFL